jgi:hypothetical protein
MRKISIDIAKAFLNGKSRTIGNSYTEEGKIVLHGNTIAWWENDIGNMNKSHLVFSLCGWGTPTTRERLNTLFYHLYADPVYLNQKNHEQVLTINDKEYELNVNGVYCIRNVNGKIFLDEPIESYVLGKRLLKVNENIHTFRC